MSYNFKRSDWRRMLRLVVLPALLAPLSAAPTATAQQAEPLAPAAEAEQPPLKPAAADETAPAEAEAPEPRFVRLTRNDKGEPTALETSIMRFVSADENDDSGLQVDLVGVVHVGDRGYYRKLNKLFTEYDAVLYELVAPEDANVPLPGRQGGHPVSLLQSGMKDALELEFQLDVIDYKAKNFIHADMTPDEMAESMKKREESFVKMFFRMMGQGAAQQGRNPSGDADMLMALFSKDRPRQMKLIMAEQLQNVEGSIRVLEGPAGSTLIGERNGKAMSVLAEQLEAGKKRVAIFYGAGHLPDMEQRLVRDFGLRHTGSTWLRAWNLAEPEAKPAAAAQE